MRTHRSVAAFSAVQKKIAKMQKSTFAKNLYYTIIVGFPFFFFFFFAFSLRAATAASRSRAASSCSLRSRFWWSCSCVSRSASPHS